MWMLNTNIDLHIDVIFDDCRFIKRRQLVENFSHTDENAATELSKQWKSVQSLNKSDQGRCGV